MAPPNRSIIHTLLLGAAYALMSAPTAGLAGTTVYRHGDSVSFAAPVPAPGLSKSFLGGTEGLIETRGVGQAPLNQHGWTFNNLGGPTSVQIDALRGKVLYTPQDANNYNAVRRYDPGFAIPPQTHFYKAHYVRNVLLLDGLLYTKSYQWKHERISWQDSVTDTSCELKVHNWPTSMGPITFLNRNDGSNEVWWGGAAAESNGGWALLEVLVFTGSDGTADGRVLTRVHKNGQTVISQNRVPVQIYSGPTQRLRYFVEQNYFGNFGQIEDGVDNTLPKPQVREIRSDDSLVQIGVLPGDGWQRVELRDSIDLRSASVRELQTWQRWDSTIELSLNTGGLAPGLHELFLVVIDGVDAEGWDQVVASVPIQVRVDAPLLFSNGFEAAP